MFRFPFVVCGLLSSWITSSWSVWHLVFGNPIEKSPQQHAYPTTFGRDERTVHLEKFGKRVLETQSQRVESVFHCRLDHQPTYQKVQDDMPRHFELDRLGSATAQVPVHPF